MGKDKIDEFIRRETQGPSIGQTVTEAGIAGIIVGAAKILGSVFNSKR